MYNPGPAPGALFLRRFAASTPSGQFNAQHDRRDFEEALLARGLSFGEPLVAGI